MTDLEGRARARQGPVQVRGGVPYGNPASTLSLLPLAAIGEWLAEQRGVMRGRLLDVGSGNRPYAAWYEPLVDGAVSVDPVAAPGLSVVGFADRLPFAGMTFDTVLCTEVLEHVADAEAAVAELHRVLRPGGHVLATVPYLYPTHEAPYDFRRFTHFGLGELFERHGFEVVSLQAKGRAPLLFAHFAVLAVVAGLQAASRMFGVDLLARGWIRALVSGPQLAALRIVGVRRDLDGSAARASLGYMCVARKAGAAS